MFDPTALATRILLFTGKGGVGKTTLACATALRLADQGARVLLVSTDPASNLDEMLGVPLGPRPTPAPGAPRLEAMNVDPAAAADDYRRRALAPYEGVLSAEELSTMREELAGACTVEIAAFDRFAGLLAGEDGAAAYDRIVFDTAPTGHTLRLLDLPRAWTAFLDASARGASCLGPHGGLTMRRERFRAARRALEDPATTTVVLVSRAERSALRRRSAPRASWRRSVCAPSASSSTAASSRPTATTPWPSPSRRASGRPSTRCRRPSRRCRARRRRSARSSCSAWTPCGASSTPRRRPRRPTFRTRRCSPGWTGS